MNHGNTNTRLFFLTKGHKIVEILALLTTKLSSSKMYKVGMLFSIQWTLIPEPTAGSAVPGVSPGRGLLIPHGYLHPGKSEHKNLKLKRKTNAKLKNCFVDLVWEIVNYTASLF